MVMNALDPFLSQTVTLDKLKVLEIKPRKGKLEKLKIGNSEMFLRGFFPCRCREVN